MGLSAINKINLGVPAFISNFVDGDLAAGILTVTHNLGNQYNSAIVYDNAGKIIIPDDVTATSTSVTTIDLTSYGTLTGTWRAVILDSGATMNSIASGLSLAGETNGDIAVFNGTAWVAQAQASAGYPSSGSLACAFLAVAQLSNLPASSTVIYNVERYDIGSDFDYNGTGKFTAPVAGYYFLSSIMRFRQLQTSGVVTTLITNTGSGATAALNTSFDANFLTAPLAGDISLSACGLYYLPAGGTSEVVITTTLGQTGVVDLDGGEFSGYLVAQT